MSAALSPFLRLFLALAFTVAAAAQNADHVEIRTLIPEKIERATKTDDAGMIQWADHVPIKCQTCAGTGKHKCPTCERFPEEIKTCVECKRTKEREVVCHACAGLGHFADPLDKAPCSACNNAGLLLCLMCGGSGGIRAEGSGETRLSCPGCRGDGGFKCGVCNGTKLVEVAAPKPNLRDANAATLAKAIATADTMLQQLGQFTPAGKNSRKETKEIVRMLSLGAALFPPLKRTPKVLEDYMGKTYGGSGFQGHEEREANAMNIVKKSAEYYLKHQKRMMELAHKRAEANEKLAAANKGK